MCSLYLFGFYQLNRNKIIVYLPLIVCAHCFNNNRRQWGNLFNIKDLNKSLISLQNWRRLQWAAASKVSSFFFYRFLFISATDNLKTNFNSRMAAILALAAGTADSFVRCYSTCATKIWRSKAFHLEMQLWC